MAKIAMLVGRHFEDVEFRKPYDALLEEGHDVTIVGVNANEELEGKRRKELVRTEAAAADSNWDDFDALVIPGGYGPDNLRTDRGVVNFVKGFFEAGRPVAAICHGPQVLIEADVVHGRRLTSWPSVKTDLINAGALWVDKQVVEDGNLITSRNPADLDAFNATIVRRLEAIENEIDLDEGEPAPPPGL